MSSKAKKKGSSGSSAPHSHSLSAQLGRTLRGSPLLATWLAVSLLFGVAVVGFTAAMVLAQQGLVEDDWSLHDIADRLPPMLRERLGRDEPSAFELDHLVLLVDDLDVAMRQFRSHGFNVTYGGVHTGGWTHNALIKFPDHTYVELLATHAPVYRFMIRALARFGLLRPLLASVSDPFKQRFLRHLAGFDGLRDVVLRAASGSPGARTLLEQFAASGRTSAPTEMSRLTPHNELASWRTVIPPSISVPFLIEWTHRPAPRSINETSHHNNGTRLLGIEIAVPDLAAAAKQWEAYLGVPAQRDGLVSERRLPEEVKPSPYPVRFQLANRQFIRLIEPGFSGPLRELLDRTMALSREPIGLGGVCSSVFLETLPEDLGDESAKSLQNKKVGTIHFNLYDTRFTFIPSNLVVKDN